MIKKRPLTYIIYGLIAFIIFIVPSFFRLLTDWYWFQEIGLNTFFTTILGTKILLGVGVGIFSFLIIYGNFWLTKRLVVSRPLIVRLSQGGVGEFDSRKYIKRLALPVSLMLSLFTGMVASSAWETVLQYLYAVPFNVQDPIFNKDISFYFFELPFIQFFVGLGFWLLIASLVGRDDIR